MIVVQVFSRISFSSNKGNDLDNFHITITHTTRKVEQPFYGRRKLHFSSIRVEKLCVPHAAGSLKNHENNFDTFAITKIFKFSMKCGLNSRCIMGPFQSSIIIISQYFITIIIEEIISGLLEGVKYWGR